MDKVELISAQFRSWLCYKFLCSMFSQGTQNHLISSNAIYIIQKVAYKVKYIDQINGVLIMFFGNLRVRLVGLIVIEAVIQRCYVKKVLLEILRKIHRKTPALEPLFQ